MKKNYNAPQITVAEMETENVLGNTSYIDVGGYGKPKSTYEDAIESPEAPIFSNEGSTWK